MKRILIGLILAASLVAGCAFIQDQRENVEACLADPGCLAKANAAKGTTETIATIGASAIPFPGAAAAPKVLGYISFGIAMLLGGRALRKKNVS